LGILQSFTCRHLTGVKHAGLIDNHTGRVDGQGIQICNLQISHRLKADTKLMMNWAINPGIFGITVASKPKIRGGSIGVKLPYSILLNDLSLHTTIAKRDQYSSQYEYQPPTTSVYTIDYQHS
jgi:hypothetical protein